MSRKSFLQGAAILALAGVVVRIIGALYRIPLTRILNADGIALYHLAYPVYGLLLTLSTAGIPGAISKMVSERLVYNDTLNARRVFHVSLILLAVVGLVSSLAMALGSHQIARLIAAKSAEAAQPSMLAAAPALFFVAIITAYRGYFQGLQHMTPTAISQIIEQAVKIVPGFFIAAELNKVSVELGAAGAMWGVALSEVVALIYLMIVYAAKKRKKTNNEFGEGNAVSAAMHPPESFSFIASRLSKLALPMMAGAIFLPLASLADASIVMNRLAQLGWMEETVLVYYGILSGMVYVLINVPSVLSLSLSTSLIPSIAESNERRDYGSVQRKSRVGLRMTMLVALPSSIGLIVLARPVLELLFSQPSDPNNHEQMMVGAELLAVSAVSVIFLSIVQSTNGTLQGIGKVYVPMVSLAIGALLKITLNYILIGMQTITIFGMTFEMNIHGAPIGTIVCYMIPSIINLVFLAKATGVRMNAAGMFIKPALASAVMGAVAWSIATYLPVVTGGKLATVIAVLVAIPVYAASAILFGAIGRDELNYMPGGNKLGAFLERHRLIKG